MLSARVLTICFEHYATHSIISHFKISSYIFFLIFSFSFQILLCCMSIFLLFNFCIYSHSFLSFPYVFLIAYHHYSLPFFLLFHAILSVVIFAFLHRDIHCFGASNICRNLLRIFSQLFYLIFYVFSFLKFVPSQSITAHPLNNYFMPACCCVISHSSSSSFSKYLKISSVNDIISSL